MDMNIIMNDSHIVSMWQVEESVKTAVVPTLNTWVTGISLSMKHERLMASRDCFNEFLCFHRMCAYPTTIVLDNGKKKKVYEDIMTPVQKLLSIPNVERYLKEDVTIESLKEKMTRMSHLENAKIMHENKQKLFAAIKKC